MIIVDRLKANLLPIAVSLLAISLVANGAFGLALRSSWTKNGALEAVLEVQKQETRQAKMANDSLVVQIDNLVDEKQKLINEMAADRDQASRILAERDRRIQAAAALAEEERRKRNELIDKKPTCKAFLDSAVSDNCPGVAQRLLERSGTAAGSLRNEGNP